MGRREVTGFRLANVERFRDRHGKVRFYFRKGHGPRRPLPGLPGSAEFMAAYAEASSSPDVPIGEKRHAPGTFSALVVAYFRSTKFKRMRPSTQEVARRILERFAKDHGHRLVKDMKREHVDVILGNMSETPAAANNLLKRLRVVIRFGIANKWRETDPTIGVDKYPEGEHHTWTEEEIDTFEAHWALGTRERTAFALALYTALRRDDVRKMTWTDVSAGRIRVVQAKTGGKLFIPIHSALAKALENWPRSHVTIIVSGRGAQYTVESFGNLMADAIDAAGLPKRCVLHGLRKAAARRLAEAGCTEKQIAAITGHKTLSEVARYTRAASQEVLADAAILSIAGLGKSERH